MTKEDSFKIKSLRERILLKEEYLDILELFGDISNISYTKYDGNDKYDVTWVEKDNINVIGEIKIRDYPLSKYKEWYIEYDKYEYLISQSYNKKLYINIHQDGIQIWDLNKLFNIEWSTNQLPINNWNGGRKEKIIGNLKQNDALIIKKEIDINKATNKAIKLYNKKQNEK